MKNLTMIDPASQHVDGKLWANVAFATREVRVRNPGERERDSGMIPNTTPG